MSHIRRTSPSCSICPREDLSLSITNRIIYLMQFYTGETNKMDPYSGITVLFPLRSWGISLTSWMKMEMDSSASTSSSGACSNTAPPPPPFPPCPGAPLPHDSSPGRNSSSLGQLPTWRIAASLPPSSSLLDQGFSHQ